MADLALGGLERIIKACLAIKKAVETVHQNKKGCRDVETCVDRVTALLSWLKDLAMGAMVHHPSFTGPLDDLAESMEEALQLVTDCQHKNALRHLLGAGDMAKLLRRVQKDIQRKLDIVSFAAIILNLEISVSVTNTLHYVGAHPPLLQPQVAGEVNSYDSNLSVIEMRPGVNSNTTMVATGKAEQHAYSSSTGLTEFNSSKWESSFHLSSVENISEGGHAYVLKQKIVIKLAMPSARSRSKAMQLVSKTCGVNSVAITGDCKDSMEVVGAGVDSVFLINALRKKVCFAELLMVGAAQERGHRRNGRLPAASQRFEELPEESSGAPPLPQASYPYVAAIERKDAGPSTRGITAHLRDAAAHLREWLPVDAMLFALAFLLFLGIELVKRCLKS